MSNLTTENATQLGSILSNGFTVGYTTPSNGNGSMLRGNRHYISYTYPDQNWLAELPPEMRKSLCLLPPRDGSRRRRPSYPPWLTHLQANGLKHLKHFNILRTRSDQATCSRQPNLENGKELLTDAIWRIVEATGNTHLGILTTAVQLENGLQIRIHIRRMTTFVDGTIESVEYHYTLQSFNTIMTRFAEARLEIGRRDPAAKQWFLNPVDLIYQTTDRAYLEVMEASSWLVENFPDAEFYRPGPSFHFLDDGIVDLVLEYVGIDLIEEEGNGSDRICAICTELMRVDKNSEHFAVRLNCGHCFGVECIRRWLEHPISGKTSCPMCRKYIHVPTYADYHSEQVPKNQPWDRIEFTLQTIEAIFPPSTSPQPVKITEPAKFLLSFQYLIGVQLHANKIALPDRYNPATYPETQSMVTALCEYMDVREYFDGFEDLLYTLCCFIAEKVGADNGISWDQHTWIMKSINREWLSWVGRTIKRAIWMTMVWTVDDWPPTDAYHCLEIKRTVNRKYPGLQQKMEELDPAFAWVFGTLDHGCGRYGFY